MSKMVKSLVCVMLMVTAFSAQGATRVWLSSMGGLWTSTANWQDGLLPGSGDVADFSAATGTIDLTTDVTVGDIYYNPAFSGTTNVLTILSDTAAPSSRLINLANTRRIRVGTGAELNVDADLKPSGAMYKDGYGTVVLKRRMPGTARTDFHIQQGRLVNEGEMSIYSSRMYLGTIEPEAGGVPEFVMREGASYVSYVSTQGNDFLFGGNYLGASG
ncbi:MAG: hypothetical protein PHU80_07470, partial [Kiritimatiellae bacterium]|nr:hypothetical protein [Kiritimatiellia bacterium]